MTASILRISLSAALASLAASMAFAQVKSVPQGAMVYTIAAGPNKLTALSVPLRDSVPGGFVGASAGKIASVAAGATNQNVITVTGAGWDPLQFRSAAQPYALRIMSGASVGRTLLIPTNQTTNTDTTLIVGTEGASLVGSVAADDRFEIFVVDTLQSFFADMVSSGAILTGATASVSDTVQLFNGTAWNTYFHNGSIWRLSNVPNVSQANVVIRPEAALLFTRRSGAAFSFTALGTVPSTPLKVVVRDGGATFLGNLFPVDRTLSNQGIQGLSGWVVGAVGVADRVLIHNGSSWQTFFNDGAWKLTQGVPLNPNVPAGRPFFLQRKSTATTVTVQNFTLPYTL